MNIFISARLRLTIWYVLIVAIVSAAFSAIIYQGVTGEIESSFKMAEVRLRTQNDTLLPKQLALKLLDRDLERAKRAVTIRFIIIDAIIIGASGFAAWILAGKTLQPIEESIEEQKRFTADASHELKTPLTSLRTELEVALRDNNLEIKEAKKLLRSNLEDVVSLQTLSENLMKLTRYSQNQNGELHEKLYINEVINEAIKKTSAMAKKKNIKIIQEVSKKEIRGGKQSLTELFMILLDNAIKYSPDKSTIAINSMIKRNKITIELKDQGIGIAKKDIPHLFDRFYRADSSRSKIVAEGYGLGLAIAKGIVERHKGTISVRSNPGKGSTFMVVLPA